MAKLAKPARNMSSVESDDSSDSDASPVFRPAVARKATVSGRVGSTVTPMVLPTMVQSDDDSDSDDAAPAPSKSRQGRIAWQEPLKSSEARTEGDARCSAGKLLAELPPEEAAPKSQRGLVAYLRKQNGVLRGALVELKEQIDSMTEEEKIGSSVPTFDFAHILELAREFGDVGKAADFEDDFPDSISTAETNTGSFCISTPRGDSDSSVQEATVHLRSELEKSQDEAARLRQALAERDSEIAALRQQLSAVSSC